MYTRTPPTLQLTMMMGLVLMMASDTLYANIGIEAGYFSWCHRHELKSTPPGRILLVLRMIGGLAGGTLFWGGMYSWVVESPPLNTWTFCDRKDTCTMDYLIHLIVFVVGIVLVIATGTWSGVTFLYDEDDDGEPNFLQRLCLMHDAEDEQRMGVTDHVRYTIRAVVSLYGQVRNVTGDVMPCIVLYQISVSVRRSTT